MPNGLTYKIYKKKSTKCRGGGEEKMTPKNSHKNFEYRLSKLKKVNSQDLVKQTVVNFAYQIQIYFSNLFDFHAI